MNINLDTNGANLANKLGINDVDNEKLNNHSKIQELISLQNQNSKLLMPASNAPSNFSIYSRDITNRLTLSSINPAHGHANNFTRAHPENNSFMPLANFDINPNRGKAIRRSHSIHATSTASHQSAPSSINIHVTQKQAVNSYRNSFVGSNRLDIIKDDLDTSNANENITSSSSSSSSSSANDSSTSSASVLSSSPSSISAIYSQTGRGFTLKKKNYDYKNVSLLNQTNSNTNSKAKNERLITDLLKNHSNLTRPPVPPNRTTSLNYKHNPFIYNNKNLNNENIYDRSSIYSTCSFRNSSCLSSLNFDNHRRQEPVLLDKNEIFRIESCYKSIGSSVHSCKCSAEIYSTNLQNLINLLDWKRQLSGVPVWVFNTGNNPKRAKSKTFSVFKLTMRRNFSNLCRLKKLNI